MHIALVSPAWPPGNYANGIVTYVGCMRKELLSQGHRVSIFSGQVGKDQRDPDVHAVRLSTLERTRQFLASRVLDRHPSLFDGGEHIARVILRQHARNPIDVIEMEETFGWAGEVARTSNIPVVVKLHGPAFLHLVEEELRTAFGAERAWREGLELARLPVIVAPSRSTLHRTVSHYSLRSTILEHVVNPVAIPADFTLWSLDSCNRYTVLFVGRFDKIKGGDLILGAFQRLLSREPRLNLVFVGPDPGLILPNGERVDIHTFIASMGDDAVRRAVSYRGRLGAAEIGALRAAALVTVNASRHESQGYTVLEAMLQGCPVVCTDGSGSSESIQHEVTGLLAPSGDPVALATQIARIVDDPQFGAALGAAGRDYVLKHHSPTTVVKQALDVYQRAIDLHRTRGAVRK